MNPTERPRGAQTGAIEVVGMSKTYDGGVRAVDGLDLTVERNTVFALLGPNGAGKTTTVSILTTLALPTSGTARVNGYDVVTDESAVRGSVGVTFQEMVLDDALSGREVLIHHGRLYGMGSSECRRRADELLSLVELSDAADRRCHTYSGGMKRRLELARALMTVPSVLFLDEPTLGLDPVGRANLWGYIQRLVRDTDITVFLTTHYLEEAERIADRVGIKNEGRLVAEGAPRELIDALGDEAIALRGEGDIEDLERGLDGFDFVQSVSRVDDGVLIGVSSASKRMAAIVGAANTAGFTIHDLSAATPDLGAVFFRLTGHTMNDGGQR